MVSARRDHFLLVVIPAYCANWLTSAPDGMDPTGKSESSPLTARYAHFCKTKSNFHKVLFRHQKSCASLMATNAKASLQLSWMRRRRNAGCHFVRRLFFFWSHIYPCRAKSLEGCSTSMHKYGTRETYRPYPYGTARNSPRT